jgi:hypothetical protein|tara:strand:+ start:351 stop:470 length:120 start_codon:yes stop_codon:yes gene_type:complete
MPFGKGTYGSKVGRPSKRIKKGAGKKVTTKTKRKNSKKI